MTEYTLEQFKKDVIQWSTDRLIIQNGDVNGQLRKLREEIKETQCAIINEDEKEIKDGIGDCAVVLINLDALQKSNTSFLVSNYEQEWSSLGQLIDRLENIYSDAKTTEEDYIYCWLNLQSIAVDLGVDFIGCCQIAWNEIKDRKGYFCNKTKTFIKEVE